MLSLHCSWCYSVFNQWFFSVRTLHPGLCETNSYFNTLRPWQDGQHFVDDIFKCIFSMEYIYGFRLIFHWCFFLTAISKRQLLWAAKSYCSSLHFIWKIQFVKRDYILSTTVRNNERWGVSNISKKIQLYGVDDKYASNDIPSILIACTEKVLTHETIWWRTVMMQVIVTSFVCNCQPGSLLLTWIKFNPSIDK